MSERNRDKKILSISGSEEEGNNNNNTLFSEDEEKRQIFSEDEEKRQGYSYQGAYQSLSPSNSYHRLPRLPKEEKGQRIFPRNKRSGSFESDEDDNRFGDNDPVGDALQRCFSQVIKPILILLSLIGWRPLPIFMNSRIYSVLDFLYPIVVAFFLFLSYFFGFYYSYVNGQVEILSEFIIEILVSFIVWCYGLWYFRREEGAAFDQLSALIETVFLRCADPMSQDKLVQMLTKYLVYGGYGLLIYTAFSLWIGMTLALEIVDDVELSTLEFVFSFLGVSVGFLVEQSIYISTVVIYWIICKLHARYLDSIRDRLSKRTISLSRAIREITSIKKLVNDNNMGWAVPVSILAFSLALQLVFIQIKLIEGVKNLVELVQTVISFGATLTFAIIVVIPAAKVSWKGERLKSMAWKLRAEQHYRKSHIDHLDSFLLFCSNTRIRAKLLGFAVWKENLYLVGSVLVAVLFLLWRIGVYN